MWLSAPPGRPHAPSVSDWFRIQCHREWQEGDEKREVGRENEEKEEEREEIVQYEKKKMLKREQDYVEKEVNISTSS